MTKKQSNPPPPNGPRPEPPPGPPKITGRGTTSPPTGTIMYPDGTTEGKWYWVRLSNEWEWFPAMRNSGSAGGWTNTDTWEDFQHEVVEWKAIDPPVRNRPSTYDSVSMGGGSSVPSWVGIALSLAVIAAAFVTCLYVGQSM